MKGTRVLEAASISASVLTSSCEERRSLELGSSTLSAGDGDGDGDDNSCGSLSFTRQEEEQTSLQCENEVGGGLGLATASTLEGSSPLGWPLERLDTSNSRLSMAPLAHVGGRDTVIWENLSKDKLDCDLSGVVCGFC